MWRIRDTFCGLIAVVSCSVKGWAIVAAGRLSAEPRSRYNPIHSSLQGPARRHVGHLAQKRRPFQGRAVGWRRDPGAALRLPPATLEQASSLRPRLSILPRSLSCHVPLHCTLSRHTPDDSAQRRDKRERSRAGTSGGVGGCVGFQHNRPLRAGRPSGGQGVPESYRQSEMGGS